MRGALLLHFFGSFVVMRFVFFWFKIIRYNNVNINVAVQTDNGLFVPVIKVSHDNSQLRAKNDTVAFRPAYF